jgi:hypothetical protein
MNIYFYISKLLKSVFSLYKYFLHLYSKKCEIERICNDSCHNSQMSYLFAISLKKSKQLSIYNKIIFYPKLFDVGVVFDFIIKKKNININSNNILLQINTKFCLHSLRYINMIIIHLEKLTKEKFQPKHIKHMNLLESFWNYMKPYSIRKCSSITNKLLSSDWVDVGFQSQDPTTDFRGMGILSLIQLEYFSRSNNISALSVLNNSLHERRYFPFAATGINVTAFLMELLLENRLHKLLLINLEELQINISSGCEYEPSKNEDLLEIGYDVIHKFYCDLFIQFNELWIKKDPPNIMSFGEIFKEFKENIRNKYPTLD